MKNKKIIILLFVVCCLLFVVAVPQATAKPTPTPTISKSEQQLNEIKDRIASRVAELKLVEKRGIIGTVTDTSDTQITISDLATNTRFIDVDEITKFSSPGAKTTFGISDLTKGEKLGILGLYNKQSRRILARFVNVLNPQKIIYGAVESIDAQNFTVKIITEKKESIDVDVEKTTKTSSYTKDSGLVKSGFSKILVEQRIIVRGISDIKNPSHVFASQIIIFPDIPKNPKIVLSQISPTLTETITPSLQPEAVKN
ncbi:MAG: hypothetical protein ABH816_03965 [Candidatus Levyibacteriota bacterium]